MKQVFKVSGMDCASCEKLLQLDVGSLPGVKSVKANAVKGTVEVEGDFDAEKVKKTIAQDGYGV